MSGSTVWIVVGAVGLSTIVIKGAGPVLVGGRRLPPAMLRVVGLLGPAVLAALVATSVFGADRRLVLDERALGVAAAALGIWRRLPPLAVVVLAAAVTAIVRHVT